MENKKDTLRAQTYMMFEGQIEDLHQMSFNLGRSKSQLMREAFNDFRNKYNGAEVVSEDREAKVNG